MAEVAGARDWARGEAAAHARSSIRPCLIDDDAIDRRGTDHSAGETLTRGTQFTGHRPFCRDCPAELSYSRNTVQQQTTGWPFIVGLDNVYLTIAADGRRLELAPGDLGTARGRRSGRSGNVCRRQNDERIVDNIGLRPVFRRTVRRHRVGWWDVSDGCTAHGTRYSNWHRTRAVPINSL